MTSREILDWRTERTYDGVFWLPTAPVNRVSGRLYLKPGSFPILSTMSPLLPEGVAPPGYLLGTTRAGDVSLFGCALISRDIVSYGEFSNQQIGLDAMLVGRHCAPDNFARRLRLRFTNTQRLASSSELWKFESPSPASIARDEVTVRFRTSEAVATVDVDGMRIDIVVHAPVLGSHGLRGDELKVKPEVDVYLAFPSLLTYGQAREVWDDLELFLGLMTGVRSDLVGGLASEHAGAADENDRDNIADPFIGVVQPDAENGESFGDFFYDLTRGSHAGLLASVLRAWMERRGALRLAANLLVDTWNRKVSWESRLGIIAQAIEAFHRTSTHRQTFIAAEQYEPVETALRTKISELTPDDDLRTSLKKRVEFGNQVSLRRRTKDLMRAMPTSLRDAFGKWQGLADNMVLARNAIIHRDPSSPAPSFRETVRVTGHFQLTVHVALLQALGVPDDVIAQRLQMQSPYQLWLSYRR